MVAISSQETSNSSIHEEGRHLNVFRCCRPIIWRTEAGSMWRNRGLHHAERLTRQMHSSAVYTATAAPQEAFSSTCFTVVKIQLFYSFMPLLVQV